MLSKNRTIQPSRSQTKSILFSILVIVLLSGVCSTQAQWSSGSGISSTTDKVGIGTATPTAKLQVDSLKIQGGGGSTNGNFIFGQVSDYSDSFPIFAFTTAHNNNVRSNDFFHIHSGETGATAYAFSVTTGGTIASPTNNALTVLASSGNVGIGTSTPTARLHIASPTSAIRAIDVTGPANNWAIVSTGNATTGQSYGQAILAGTNSSDVAFQVYDATNTLPRFFIRGDGKIGIGKANPTTALDVQGDIQVSGNIAARYQDVAEWVPASEQLSAGTVVVLDSTKSNQVTSSSVSYDTRVAGVISEQPGIALGEKSENKVLVATTGRVRVKVDATRSPIHIGDLLVTSDVPGMAMKSEPVEFAGRKMHMPGTFIGKALEPLGKGRGEILVLLSLQ